MPISSAPRIVVVSAEQRFREDLGQCLQGSSATVELVSTLEAIDAATPPAVCVLHAASDADVRADLVPPCPLIVATPHVHVPAVVAMFQRLGSVAALSHPEPARVAALATQIARGQLEDLGRWLPAAPRAETQVVSDFAGKASCLARVSAAAEKLGIARRTCESIQQCLDELLMNALYDAPVNARGEHVFEGFSIRERVKLRTGQSVIVQWACDGNRFGLVVRDAFGTLERETFVRHLAKSIQSAEAVDSKVGGAGLGLYLITEAASRVWFEIVPGVATQVSCAFELQAGALVELGFIVHDARGRARTPPARRRLATRYRLRRAAIAATAIVAAATGVWAWPRLFGPARITVATTPGATIELDGRVAGTATDGTLTLDDLEVERVYRVTAQLDAHEARREVVRPRRGDNHVDLALEQVSTVEIDSQPSGALVEVDAHAAGSTPLSVTTLAPGAVTSISIALPGYRVATSQVTVPPRGRTTRIAPKLEPTDELVRVHLVSKPPGALIVREGERPTASHTYTPADVYVEPEQLQRFTLSMPKHEPLVIPPFAPPRGTKTIEKGGELTPL
jgi:hypothetical protein